MLLSYSILIQNCSPGTQWLFLVQFLFKIVGNCSPGAQCSFLIQLLFKINTNCSLDRLAAPVLLSYSVLIRNWYKLVPWQLGDSSAPFLFNSYPKLIQIAPLTAWLLQCSFLIQFLFKINTNCTLDSLAAYCYELYGIVFHSVGYWCCRCLRVSFDILKMSIHFSPGSQVAPVLNDQWQWHSQRSTGEQYWWKSKCFCFF